MPITYLTFLAVKSDWGLVEITTPGATVAIRGGVGELVGKNGVKYAPGAYKFDWQVIPIEVTFPTPVEVMEFATSKGTDGSAKGDRKGTIVFCVGKELFENAIVLPDGINKKTFSVPLTAVTYPVWSK